MEWFEQVKDTVIKTAGVAYEKSEKLVDIAKIKLSIANLESETDKLYKELGKQYYKMENGTDTKDICAEIIKSINEKISETEALKSQLNQVKNLKSCPKCNKSVSGDNAFCPFCGEKLDDDETIIIE